MSLEFQLAAAGAALFASIVCGFVVSRLGKPYNQAVLAVHKLVSLVAAVFHGILFFGSLQSAQPDVPALFFLGAAGMSMLGLFVTGALLSFYKKENAAFRVIHVVSTVTAVVALALGITLLVL